MKLAVATLITMVAASAQADTPERCSPLGMLAPVTVADLPVAERDAARSTLDRVRSIARHRGSTAPPVLMRLPASRPGSAHLVATVPGEDGHLVALVYHSTALRQSHSLVDARPVLVEGVQEPRLQGIRETDGISFRLYDFGDHEISVSESATHPAVDGKFFGRIRRSVVIETGYSFDGPSSCRLVRGQNG
ncbi:hypothetical protein [Methylobacterium platani]|uniref:Uncharacterized protein n=2 Tax=Methylobacterium platani TaxID=427683 RepID=A0A179SI30_9HYPH|nr:hypothetical protein [Methylobacterium platani]KMO12586.1 hypothetical protein SQ03_24035 [Methylobacterium platani JCM 14648]OAS26212.1 hypothetical protein A5481_06420 [Methylobacterium platani]